MAISPVFREAYRAQQQQRQQKRAAHEQAEADAAGMTVAQLRDRKDADAKRKWQERTQSHYVRAKGESALAKRNARIERMQVSATSGRF